jgi:hypothetical protein
MVALVLKTPTRGQKSFRMISLSQIAPQVTWIDILTKKHRGGGYIPFSNYPIPATRRASTLRHQTPLAGCETKFYHHHPESAANPTRKCLRREPSRAHPIRPA